LDNKTFDIIDAQYNHEDYVPSVAQLCPPLQ